MTDATISAAGRPSPGAVAAVVVGAALSLLPAVPAFRLSRAYGRIPVLSLRTPDARSLPPAHPPLLDPRSLSVRDDGALAVADWAREGVLAIAADGSGSEWLPFRGQFEVQHAEDGRLALLDVADGTLSLLGRDGRSPSRVRIRLSSAPALCAAPGGGLFVSDGRKLVRLGADLQPSQPADILAVEGIRGVASTPDRLYVSTSSGWLRTYSAGRELVNRTPLVGNPGRLAALPGGGVLMADERTARLWEFDRDGRLLGRLDTAGQTAVALGVLGGTTVAVAGDRRVAFLLREAR